MVNFERLTKAVRFACGLGAVLAFLFVLGTVGAMENDMVTIGTGVIRCGIGTAAMFGLAVGSGAVVL